jgi:hypothetical protein
MSESLGTLFRERYFFHRAHVQCLLQTLRDILQEELGAPGCMQTAGMLAPVIEIWPHSCVVKRS